MNPYSFQPEQSAGIAFRSLLTALLCSFCVLHTPLQAGSLLSNQDSLQRQVTQVPSGNEYFFSQLQITWRRFFKYHSREMWWLKCMKYRHCRDPTLVFNFNNKQSWTKMCDTDSYVAGFQTDISKELVILLACI